jgi:serine/threonine protein kinase
VIAPPASVPVTLLGGRYRLGEAIAHGGSADVYRAVAVRRGRAGAIKRPRGAEAHAGLRREATMLARCAHPGVVTCLDSGEDETGAPYVVLQLGDGVNLAQHAEAGTLDAAAANAWGREVARAVAHTHARGIVHGDLKPQHVMIGRDGRAVLVDFDRAHDVAEAGVPGTGIAAFAAPDVRAGAATTVQSDRFALRAVLRWLDEQTGRRD